LFKKLASVAAIAATVLLGVAAPASATAALTGTMPAATAENTNVPLSFNLTGSTWADVLVTVSVAEGTLTVTPSGDVVASAGYDLSDNTVSRQSFHGSLADVVDTLQNGLVWITPSTVGSYTLDFTLKAQEYVAGLSYNPDNGHYYIVPDETMTAADAFSAAANGDYVYAGIVGYIAEINDADENEFVADFSGGEDIWIGGSAEHSIIDAYTEAGHSSDSDWVWIHSWENFAIGIGPAVAQGGAFTGFADGEPNGGSGVEGCLVTNYEGVLGEWNDLACNSAHHSFIVEFDPADGSEETVLTLSDEILNSLASTGFDATGAYLAAGVLALVGATGAIVSRRRRAL
jgi:methionine-rich copper-binding protein CopC